MRSRWGVWRGEVRAQPGHYADEQQNRLLTFPTLEVIFIILVFPSNRLSEFFNLITQIGHIVASKKERDQLFRPSKQLQSTSYESIYVSPPESPNLIFKSMTTCPDYPRSTHPSLHNSSSHILNLATSSIE